MTTKKDIKLNFLDAWTPELGWWLGCVYGDGCVHRNYYADGRLHFSRVVFGCSDRSTTMKWRALVCPDSGLQERTDVSNDFVYAYVDDKRLVDWFAERGVVGEKATNLKWPDYLPEEFNKDFLRGLWDTDGSIIIEYRKRSRATTQKKTGNDTLVAGFTAKNPLFAKSVLDAVCAGVMVAAVTVAKNTKYVQKYDKTYTWYSLKWTGAPALKIAKWLYSDAPEHIRGSDRYDNYIKYLDMLKDRVCDACGEQAWSDNFCQTHWWENWSKEHPKGMCSMNCGRDACSKGLCLRCYKREKRKLDPAYGQKANGVCACGKPCFRKGKCHACYSRDYRARQSDL